MANLPEYQRPANADVAINVRPGPLSRVYIDYQPANSGSSFAQTAGGFHHARLVVAQGDTAPAGINGRPTQMQDASGRTIEPDKLLRDPTTRYPNLCPADAMVQAWGFSMSGGVLDAYRGNKLVLERFKAGLTWQYWPGSWQKFLGFTRWGTPEIDSQAEMIFNDEFKFYDAIGNNCEDFARRVADKIVEQRA